MNFNPNLERAQVSKSQIDKKFGDIKISLRNHNIKTKREASKRQYESFGQDISTMKTSFDQSNYNYKDKNTINNSEISKSRFCSFNQSDRELDNFKLNSLIVKKYHVNTSNIENASRKIKENSLIAKQLISSGMKNNDIKEVLDTEEFDHIPLESVQQKISSQYQTENRNSVQRSYNSSAIREFINEKYKSQSLLPTINGNSLN